jgi:hypothetical protein
VIGVDGDGNRVWCVERCSGTGMRSSSKDSNELNSSRVSIRRFLAAFGRSRGSREGEGNEMI